MSNMKTMFDLNAIDSQGGRMNIGATQTPQQVAKNALEVRNLNFFYGAFQGLKNINLDIALGVLAPGDFQSQGRYFHFYQFE